MNLLALLFSLPMLVSGIGGCCLVPVVLHGVETFRASVGTPAGACEGQWASLSCDEFESAQDEQGAELVKPEEELIANLSDSVLVEIDSVTSFDPLTDSTISSESEEVMVNLSSSMEADIFVVDPVNSTTFDVISLESEEVTANLSIFSLSEANSSVDLITSPKAPIGSVESPPSVLVEPDLNLPVLGAVEGSPTLSFRFADLSGCGAFRTCPGCIANTGCMWSLSGCTQSTGTMEQWCSPIPNEDTVKLPCELLTGCNKCTSTAGCIWYRGTCAYSRGIGCMSDPDNCINYAWNCPAEHVNPVIPRYQGGTYLPVASNIFGGASILSTVPEILVPVSAPNPQLTIATPSNTLQSGSSNQPGWLFSDPFVQSSTQQRPPTPQPYSPQQVSQTSTLIVPAYSPPATSQMSTVQQVQQYSLPPTPSSQQVQTFRPSPPLVRFPDSQSSSTSEFSYSRPSTTTTAPTPFPNRERQSIPLSNQFIIPSFFDQVNIPLANSQPQPQLNFQPTNYIDFSQSTQAQYRPPAPEPRQSSQYPQPSNSPQTLQSFSGFFPQLGQPLVNQVRVF